MIQNLAARFRGKKDAGFFSTTKKGEVVEWGEAIRSTDKNAKKDGIKRIIAAMTVGKDVSSLFGDVVKCMQTDDLELKKLVYLYLINYAKTKPDLTLLAVNTFVKDLTQDPNPLIRALAVRTMGCIRVDKITEYICDPLQQALRDTDPYVRKTAAVCVAKLYDISPELVNDRGFPETLRDMMSDPNPMVVANAVAALAEIQEVSGTDMIQSLGPMAQNKLLAAVNECTEWGQVFILDALARLVPSTDKECQSIIERVTPRLQHANCAVVLSAMKVVLRCMNAMVDQTAAQTYCRRLAPPLVSLLSNEAEIQYVALRNIQIILQRWPQILSNEVKVFFCKYNDPLYVKMEKLDILTTLASPTNIDQVLLELKEYATEVDMEFVRKSVRAVGACAIKDGLEAATEKCVGVLVELIKTKVNYVVQEAIIVIKDIFRKYPNRYESVIATLCENLDSLDEPEAKASMVWIIGEYAERIDNAPELLEIFLEGFPEEPAAVQLQLLTAAVKLFLQRPTEDTQRMIQLVLSAATNETDNPDLRDRAYIYWRLLSNDPDAARGVVLAEKPRITTEAARMDPSLRDELLASIATLASVYHRPGDTFIARGRVNVQRLADLEAVRRREVEEEGGIMADSGVDQGSLVDAGGAGGLVDLLAVDDAPAAPAAAQPAGGLGDLLGTGAAAPTAAPSVGGGLEDLLGGLGGLPAGSAGAGAGAARSDMPVVLPASQGKGIEVSARLVAGPGIRVAVRNLTNQPLGAMLIQLNKNAFGITGPADSVIPLQPATIPPNALAVGVVPLSPNPAAASPPGRGSLQVAVKTPHAGVVYFELPYTAEALVVQGPPVAAQEFVQSWPALPAGTEGYQSLPASVSGEADLAARLRAAGMGVVHSRPGNAGEVCVFASARVLGGSLVLLDVRVTPGAPGVRAMLKSQAPHVCLAVLEALKGVVA